MRVALILAGLILMVGIASGHSQEVYTVIYSENGAAPADIPNETIRKHDAVWFWMKDSTENASLIITLTKGDLEYSSTNLTKECAVDEDGNKVDDACETRFDFEFEMAAAVGLWIINYSKYINGSLSEYEEGSVYVMELSHDELEEVEDSLFTLQNIAYGVAILSFIGMLFLTVSILKNQDSSEEE